MKILAIRGKNLASLAGEFCVDFQSEPLARAGLFAITGPTGSGKSTLLDALCLALYERTPRLQKASAKGETIPDVGDNAVSPGDPRTLLRRGASEGYAEVDFVGNDGVAYRARWSVRRARAKADGKLQASEVSLLRLVDSQVLGEHRKTETLQRIEACIGLSFEQFTRAVLLAQNDFATFLRAPDDERAELLQTLTGTETFAHISRQAYARMKHENEGLARLQEQLQGQQPLSDTERVALEATRQEQVQSVAAQQARQQALQGHLRWHAEQAQHLAAWDAAQAEHARASDAQQAAADRRHALDQLEQVQAARPLWTECQRLTRVVQAASQTQAETAAQLAQAEQALQPSQAALDSARQQAEKAESQRLDTQAALGQARALDASIAALMPGLQAMEAARAESHQQLETQTQQRAQTAEEIRLAQKEQASLQDWLVQHASLRLLGEGWQRWETLLGLADAALAAQTGCEADMRTLAQQVEQQAQQETGAQQALTQAAAKVQGAQATHEQLEQRCEAIDVEGLAARKLALQTQGEQLQAAALLWQRRCELRARRIALQAQQQGHAKDQADAQALLQACSQDLPARRAALQSAEQAFHRARLAASGNAQAMRAQLQPDTACPVCGAMDHPYAAHAPALDAVLQGLQDHVEQCQEALLVVQQQVSAARANQASSGKALEQGRLGLDQLAAQRETLMQAWTALALQAELDAVPEDARSAWLQKAQESARKNLAELAAQEAQYHQLLKEKDAAQQALNAANLLLQEARDALQQLQQQASQIAQRRGHLAQQQAEQVQRLQDTEDQLDGAFGHSEWRTHWRAEPQAFVARCRSDAQAWNTQQQSLASVGISLNTLQLQAEAQALACEQARQQLATQDGQLEDLRGRLQGFQVQRSLLLQGQSVEAVEQQLQAAIHLAKTRLDGAQAAWQAAQQQHTRLQEARRLAGEQLALQQRSLDAAQAALRDWLQAHNASALSARADLLTLERLQSLLERDAQWLASERDALQALQDAVHAAVVARDIRQQALAAHAARREGEDSVETLQAQLQAVADDLQRQNTELSALQLALARDDERLAASHGLCQQIEQQAASARVWSLLGELIGSADGKKFRNFAQQLTLDILLGYGNRHLQSLSRRYRIQRIADSLGLLVVDQDMGDELRSVHSLSGGESFLVSLALALGLASLSSHRVRVESLFIDEGFGSLDADSLRVALDALDSLQSLGRKVGVISHVAEMTERIGTQVRLQRQPGGLSRIAVV